MNVKRAIDRVNEWMSAGKNLKAHMSATDEVLASWMAMLEEFVQDLPQLQQLSSDALKVSVNYACIVLGCEGCVSPKEMLMVAFLFGRCFLGWSEKVICNFSCSDKDANLEKVGA